MDWPEGETASEEYDQLVTQDSAIDALFEQGLAALQEGRWNEAASSLEEVLRQQPDHPDAQALLDEVRLKASLPAGKPRARLHVPRLPTRPLLLLVGSLAIIVLAVVGLRQAYSRWVLPSQIAQEVERVRTALLTRAFAHAADQDYVAAEAAFMDVLEQFPENPQAQEGIENARERMVLDEDYTLARAAVSQRDWQGALSALEDITARDRSYRDVEELTAFATARHEVETAFAAAEDSYASMQWLQAISAYKALIALDGHFERGAVTEHLFESYLCHGRQLIHSTKGEGDAVGDAVDWFLKALALQPRHQRALYEIALAERYLEGRRLLAQPSAPEDAGRDDPTSLSRAVQLLQWVYQQEPDYADGTVATILKAATEAEHEPEPQVTGDLPLPAALEPSFEELNALYLQQGDEALAAGDYALAAEQYQAAAGVAIHGGYDSAKWLFAAYVKLGTAQAAQAQNDLAVAAFQIAIEVGKTTGLDVPEEDYAALVDEGDLMVQNLDYAAALEFYTQALEVMSAECDCGLENWSIIR